MGISGRRGAQVVDVGVAADLVHPGAELAFAAEGMPVLEDAQEDLLHQVLAQGRSPVRRRKKL